MVASTLPPLRRDLGIDLLHVDRSLGAACAAGCAGEGLALSDRHCGPGVSLRSRSRIRIFAFRHPADRLTEQLRSPLPRPSRTYSRCLRRTLLLRNWAKQFFASIASRYRTKPMQELYNAVVARDLPTRRITGRLTGAHHHARAAHGYFRCLCFAASRGSRAGVARTLRRDRPPLPRPHGIGTCRSSTRISNPTLLDRVEAVSAHASCPCPRETRPAGEAELVALPADKVPFLIPGALTNKDTVAFALKLTLCVVVCYVFYFAVAWPGISTSVTTVFLTALGNTGAIKQKARQPLSRLGHRRRAGDRRDDLSVSPYGFHHLARGADFGRWLSLPRGGPGKAFGYAGLQIAFSFYIVAFEGFSAPAELAPARDRLMGILWRWW